MPTYSLNLENVKATNLAPRPKYQYVNNVRTDVITGYSYRLMDVNRGEFVDVTIPTQKVLQAQGDVKVINPMGTPYIYQNRATLSIKADDIRPINS